MHSGVVLFGLCIIYHFVISAPMEKSRTNHDVNKAQYSMKPLTRYDSNLEEQSSLKTQPEERSTIFIHNSKHRHKKWKHYLETDSEKLKEHANIHKDFIKEILRTSELSTSLGLVDPYTLSERIVDPERKTLIIEDELRDLRDGYELDNRFGTAGSQRSQYQNKDQVFLKYSKPNGFAELLKTPLTHKHDVSKLYAKKNSKQEILPTTMAGAEFEYQNTPMLASGYKPTDFSSSQNEQSTNSTDGTETPIVTYYVNRKQDKNNNIGPRLGKSCRYYSCAMKNVTQDTTKTEANKRLVLTCRCMQKKGTEKNTSD